MAMLIQLIIILIVCGVLYWAVKLIIDLIPMDAWFKQIIQTVLLIAIVIIVVFYILIPLLQQLPSLLPHLTH